MLYIVTEFDNKIRLYVYRGDKLVSEATDRHGNPLLVLRKKGFVSELCVSSMQQLHNVLKLAGPKVVTETRRCLEGISQWWIFFRSLLPVL